MTSGCGQPAASVRAIRSASLVRTPRCNATDGQGTAMSRSTGEPTLRRQLRTFRQSLTAQDRASLGGMLGTIVVLHVVGFGLLFGLVIPQHYQLGRTGLFGAGV